MYKRQDIKSTLEEEASLITDWDISLKSADFTDMTYTCLLYTSRKDENYEKRTRFVAAKIDDNVTLYDMCSQKEYERTIVNKSIGLFLSLRHI